MIGTCKVPKRYLFVSFFSIDFSSYTYTQWVVDYLAPYGTYVIKNFANMEVYLQPGAPPSRRDVPKAEINSYQFQWVIAEAPNGHGYLYAALLIIMPSARLLNHRIQLRSIVKADEQDQVLQAVSYGPDVSTTMTTF